MVRIPDFGDGAPGSVPEDTVFRRSSRILLSEQKRAEVL